MKSVSSIIISATTLILLIFGAGGIGYSKCSCSGKTSLLIPLDDDCCPSESGCMSITVMHFSASEMQDNLDTPQPHPVMVTVAQVVPQATKMTEKKLLPGMTSWTPPPNLAQTLPLLI